MTGQDHSALELLRRRVELIGAVSALNAKALKLIQQMSGMDMEILRLELELGRNASSEQLVRELHETEDSAAAMRAAHADCLEEIATAEADVAELDRLIAATRGS